MNLTAPSVKEGYMVSSVAELVYRMQLIVIACFEVLQM